MESMHILQSVPDWLPKTATWLYNHIQHLPEEITTHVVCEETANLELFGHPRIHSFEDASVSRYYWDIALRKTRFRRYLGYRLKVAAKIRPDLIHSHFGTMGWEDMKIAQKLDVAHIITFYGFDVHLMPSYYPEWRARYKELFSHCSYVLCEGPYMMDSLKKLGCPSHKVRLFHLGIELGSLPFKPRRLKGDESIKFLICGSFNERKGIPDALSAIAMYRQMSGRSIRITVIGDTTPEEVSREETSSIMKTVGEHGLGKSITWMGYQPAKVLYEEAYRHHIFISPSKHASNGDSEGGAPVTLIEMLATGMPIVSTTHCDIPNIITHRKTGWLAGEGNVAQLAELIHEAVNNRDKWPEMVKAGRKRVEEEFNVPVQSEKLADIYRSFK